MNVGGNPGFGSSMNAIGGSIQGLSSNLANVGNRNSAPGLAASPVLGNLGPRIASSGNIFRWEQYWEKYKLCRTVYAWYCISHEFKWQLW